MPLPTIPPPGRGTPCRSALLAPLAATWLVLTALLTAALPARAAELGADLAGLLEVARAQSPELAAMRHEASAASVRLQSAVALPDPVLRVELENINNYGNGGSFNLLPSKVGETKYTLMQTVPLAGRRGLRRDVAAADVQQAEARSRASWAELSSRIKAAHAQHYLASRNRRLAGEVLDLMGRLEQLAQARYASGLAAQQDAIRAQLEQTAMRAELIALDSEQRQARTRLNALLARESTAALAEPESLRSLPAPEAVEAEALSRRVEASNPALAAELARLHSAQGNRELTYSNRSPDVLVGLSPTQMGSRITSWGLMFEVAIPLQRDARRAQELEAESMLNAQRARLQALQAQLAGELGEALAALDAARRSEALVAQQLLPQSELSFRSALAAYEAGKVDFATLLDAQRQIRKARQDQLKAQVEAQLRLADIERILGDDL